MTIDLASAQTLVIPETGFISIALAAGAFEVRVEDATVELSTDAGFTDPVPAFPAQGVIITLALATTVFIRKAKEGRGSILVSFTSTAAAGFGADYQTQLSAARSVTSSSTFQTKVSLSTMAITGVYRVGWHAVGDNEANNMASQYRLQNVTDAVTLGSVQIIQPTTTSDRFSVDGFDDVTFVGLAKTFAVQFSDVLGGSNAGIQDARIEFWRVS